MTGTLRLAICIVTRQRQDRLARLLDALDHVRQPEGAIISVIVVDNDAAGSSRSVVTARSADARWPIEYHVEPKPGIPFARNASIALCYRTVDAVVFIDDDEIPQPEWLCHLLATRAHFAADVVTGPVLPRFDVPPPKWAEEGGFFDFPRFTTGSVRDVAFTNNVLVNSSVFASVTPWFDERLQFTGGSDTHFFRRVHLRGYKIVWSDDARVDDCLPASRVTVRWVIQRAYRYGHTHAFVRVDLKQSSRAAIARAAAGKLRFVGASVLHGIVARRPARFIDAAREAAYMAGMIANLFGSRYAEYQITGTS